MNTKNKSLNNKIPYLNNNNNSHFKFDNKNILDMDFTNEISIENKQNISIAKTLFLENSINNNLTSDVSKNNYLSINRDNKNEFIYDMFIDNIGLTFISDFEYFKGKYENMKMVMNKEYLKEKKMIIQRIFSIECGLEERINSEIKLPLVLTNEIYNKNIKEVRNEIKYILKNKKISNPVITYFKLSTSDFKYKKILKLLYRCKNKLLEKGFIISDIDFTRDMTGIFYKPLLIDYLINNHNFLLQKDSKFEEYYNRKIILEHSYGNDCLIYLYTNTKVKLYNKFICQMTSPGTNTNIGNHLFHYIQPKNNSYLSQLFTNKKFINEGCTRLEVTIFRTNFMVDYYIEKKNKKKFNFENIKFYKDIFNIEKINNYFKKLELIFLTNDNVPIYKTPVSYMWNTLTSNLQCNCILYFEDKKEFFVALWVNKMSGKITGHHIKIEKYLEKFKFEKIKQTIISHYSLNLLPCYYIKIKDRINLRNNKIKTYVKEGETYITKFYHCFNKIKNNIDLNSIGLIQTNNFKPIIFTKTVFFDWTNYLYQYVEIKKDKKLFFNNFNNKSKLLQKNTIDKLSNNDINEELQTIYKNKIEKKIFLINVEKKLKLTYKKDYDELKENEPYTLYSFSYNKNIPYPTIHGLAIHSHLELDDDDELFSLAKHIVLTGQLKNKIKDIINNTDINTFNKYESYYTTFYKYDDLNRKISPLIRFKTGQKSMYNNKKFMTFTYTNYLYNTINFEQTNDIFDDTWEVKTKHCLKLESLNTNSTYTVLKLKHFYFRNISKLYIQLENNKNIYISNTWFEREYFLKGPKISFTFTTLSLVRYDNNGKKTKEMVVLFNI